MILDNDLNEKNFLLYAMIEYNNPQCIIFYNVFPPKAATKILFYKIEERFWPILKTFLFYLNLLPENEIGTIMGKKIKSKEIDFDQGVVNTLRKFDKEG